MAIKMRSMKTAKVKTARVGTGLRPQAASKMKTSMKGFKPYKGKKGQTTGGCGCG